MAQSKSLLSLGNRIDGKDIVLFTRQLYTMLNAGIALVQALDMVGHSTRKPALKALISAIKEEVEEGHSLTLALSQHPRIFSNLYRGLVQAGEEAGALEALLDKLAVYLEKTEALKGKIKKGLFYPAVVFSFACAVTTILLIFVIPTFEDLFKGFGADLPALTQTIIELSEVLQARWYLVFSIPIGMALGLTQSYRHSPKFRRSFDKWILKFPLIGTIISTSANARFARTLSTMFNGGVPLVEAMRSAAGATGNRTYEAAVLAISGEVAVGHQLNLAMQRTKLFPDLVVQMVAVGEESGALGDMLTKVADIYEDEVDTKIDNLTALIEPALMAFLAIVIGGLVVAMYLPIFKLAAEV